MSFRYGESEEIRNHRLFHDYTEKTAKRMVKRQENLEILDMWQSEDVRGNGQRWLNLLVKKQGTLEKEE